MLTTRLVSGPARFHNRERRDGVKRSPVGEADRRLLAGGAGFEPAIEDPKSPALPLGYRGATRCNSTADGSGQRLTLVTHGGYRALRL